VRLTLLAAFGAGYVLGTRAGRERYDQIRELAMDTSHRLEQSGWRDRLDDYGGRLERYATRNGQPRSSR
jgi:hypothetical protein